MSEEHPVHEDQIDTGGGAYVGGSVDTGGGDFVGRDKITTITEELAYKVEGLPNPYPGLQSYTYTERSGYAGREAAVQAAVARLTNPAERQQLAFVTGVSGSGKSSFVQAGLLPALESYYSARGKQVRLAVFQPSSSPLALLGDALAQLELPEPDLDGLDPESFTRLLSGSTPASQVNLLVIDQFEELFSQSPAEQSARLFALLENLPPFEQGHTHVLATLRSDYLDELFKHPALWETAVRQGVELRAMSAGELRLAILGPLEARCQAGDERFCRVRFEPGLLKQLAQEAAAEPAYLPLLQVSLQDLWVGGSLKQENFLGLAQAIEQRAGRVYDFQDYDQPAPGQPRPPEEQADLLSILTDLVHVSLDDDPRRDVRRRRPKAALAKDSPLRARLIEDLVAARLLRTGLEQTPDGQVETVDIIHEALLQNWGRLREMVRDQRELLRRRARFEQELSAWLDHDRSDEYLLLGIHLKEARQLSQARDISFHDEAASDLLARSERLSLNLQKVPVLQRLFLWVTAGGGIGFALAFGITYLLQTFESELFPFLLVIELVLGLICTAVYGSGIVLAVLRKSNLNRNQLVLIASLSGAVSFALLLGIDGILTGNFLLTTIAQAAIWGGIAGAGVAWALLSSRPTWLTWTGVGLVSGLSLAVVDTGLALLIGAGFQHIYQRPNTSDLHAAFPILLFLAGAIVPLSMLLAARLGRIHSALRDLIIES